jgi:small subunit ribosomal protein S8
MMTDPIADMLTRIRNASLVHKQEVVVPFSKIKMGIARILVREGYLAKAEEKKENHPYIILTLKYQDGEPAIRYIKRMSSPGSRRYLKKENIKKIINGYGLAILSTPQGLLSDKEARLAKVGGELICEVY